MAIAVDDPAFVPHRRWRRKAINGTFKLLARAGRYFLVRKQAHRRIEVLRDVAYGPHRYHRLDIYRPQFAPRPMPVLLYIHGGAFMLCSKETHHGIALAHAARSDYLVFNIDYRLAPHFKYPAAHEDACRAFCWVVQNCARYGGDPTRIVVAGESAGGNLALAVAVASAYERPEAWAREVFDCGVRPAAVAPLMPYLQVSNPLRQALNPAGNFLAVSVAQDIAESYLGATRTQAAEETLMADPIRVLEECEPARPLPPVFSGVGTVDLCCEDVRRLAIACERLKVPATIHFYEREVHAFHVLRWRSNARLFWRENMKFLRDIADPQLIVDAEVREVVEAG
jgi:acetyl esterase